MAAVLHPHAWRAAARRGLISGLAGLAGMCLAGIVTAWVVIVAFAGDLATVVFVLAPLIAVCVAGIPVARSYGLPLGAGVLLSPTGFAVSALVAWYLVQVTAGVMPATADLDATFWILTLSGWVAWFAVAHLVWPPRPAFMRSLAVVSIAVGLAFIASLWAVLVWATFWVAVTVVVVPTIAHLDTRDAARSCSSDSEV